MGDIKLNPAIKLWGGLGLFLLVAVGGLVFRVVDYMEKAEECAEKGGAWTGSLVPARLGTSISLSDACVFEHEQPGEEW
ncbi:Holliday junction DNA helicase B [Erythrobacter sp. SD-21]|nr:Holliday junction DNA helicase B [Erythrobacter sp. SD-21]